jgi:hypothetical protein
MYVGKKGPVFELISCLRDARSNGKETISPFNYPIHVYVHFCPTLIVRDRGSRSGGNRSRSGSYWSRYSAPARRRAPGRTGRGGARSRCSVGKKGGVGPDCGANGPRSTPSISRVSLAK